MNPSSTTNTLTHKRKEKVKRKVHLYRRIQRIDTEGKIQNHNFANVNIKSDGDKDVQWMLKALREGCCKHKIQSLQDLVKQNSIQIMY